LFYLSRDPLPFRTLNRTLPGHGRSTLEEADDFIAAQLASCGYAVTRDPVRVQAFRRDSAKPMPHQFVRPEPHDPWYTAHNLWARKTGAVLPQEIVLLVAHKDSQSWIESPGAHDNAVGTVAVLEIARLLRPWACRRSVWFLFCNEEHVPWTSEVAARSMVEAGLEVVAVLNLDGLSGKSARDAQAGRKTNVTRFVTAEGERLADTMAELNLRYALGLEQSKVRSKHPDDDDGSFVKAGFPAAVLNIGSFPYADANYHGEGDRPEQVDLDNLVMSVRLSLAFVLHMDVLGK
jgi:hypothetical protein